MGNPKTTDSMVAALLREREGYLAQGQLERAEQVTEQLALRGYQDEKPAEEPAEKPSEKPADVAEVESRTRPPRDRRAPGRQTTD